MPNSALDTFSVIKSQDYKIKQKQKTEMYTVYIFLQPQL